MKLPLKGIIPPVVTPLLDDVTLDVEGLERLIDHIIEGVYMVCLSSDQVVRDPVYPTPYRRM